MAVGPGRLLEGEKWRVVARQPEAVGVGEGEGARVARAARRRQQRARERMRRRAWMRSGER